MHRELLRLVGQESLVGMTEMNRTDTWSVVIALGLLGLGWGLFLLHATNSGIYHSSLYYLCKS